jgi:hypothetical protein
VVTIAELTEHVKALQHAVSTLTGARKRAVTQLPPQEHARFTLQGLRKLLSSGIQRRVARRNSTDVSEEHVALICSVEDKAK